jgi:hypothetical protein
MPEEAERRDCPFCKESIKADAVKCRYCGSKVEPDAAGHEGTCPFCKEEIKPGATKCRYCQSQLGPSPALQGERFAGRIPAGDCGCGCGGAQSFRGGAGYRVAARYLAPSPVRDWLNCAEYCFLENIGDEAATDHCIIYRCGGW